MPPNARAQSDRKHAQSRTNTLVERRLQGLEPPRAPE